MGPTLRSASPKSAHYLHDARPLEVVVRPPVEQPRALAWVPREESLVVASEDGSLHLVETLFGTRRVGTVPSSPARISVRDGLLAVLDRRGELQVRDFPDGPVRWSVPTGLLGGYTLAWWRRGVAVAGNDAEARRVVVFDLEGKVVARARVPERTALGSTGDGHLVLARSTDAGLDVSPFGRPLPAGTPTEHHLVVGPDLCVAGVATGGVTYWPAPRAAPVTIKIYDVCTVTLSPDGGYVAAGTRLGGVAISPTVVGGEHRVRPARIEGHEGPVVAMEFATRGRWLATAAERCLVWSF